MSKDNIIESYLLEGTIKLLGWSDDDEDFKNYKTWTSTGLGLEFIMKISNNRFYK
jgi:ribosomal 30S subunit maturation factor RimM